jgi:protein TonB
MRPRLSFVISILAACGIHAVVLLVPRVAPVAEVPIPTIELDLAAPQELVAAAPVVAKKVVAARAVTVVPVQPAAPAAQQQLPAAPAPVEAADGLPSAETAVEYSDSDGAAVSSAAALPAGAPVQTSALPAAQPIAAPVLIPPRPRSEILPAYPRSARRAGLEGVVKVAAVVNESGEVTGVEIFATSGHPVLDQAALEAVRRALFAPARQEGKPVICRVVIPIRFQLEREKAP